MIDDGFYCMDCFDGMAQIDDKSIDMILCDLPYGTTQCSWDVVIPFEPLWSEYKRIIKDGGAIVLFGTQPFTSALIMSNLPMFKYELIYEKTQPSGHLNVHRMPMRYHENILVFYKHQPIYNPQKTYGHKRKQSKGQIVHKSDIGNGCYGAQEKGANYDSTERFPKSILRFSNGLMKQKSVHHTQKPVELCEYLINTYTNVEDLVLDNCAGSCSTGIACHNTGRRFIGFEKDKEIFEKGNRRLADHKSQMSLFDLGMERK